MKIFRTVRKQYAILGIRSSNQSIRNYSFNKRILFGFLLFAYLILSHFVYFFHVANGFMDCMECICSLSASIIMFVCLAAIVFRKNTLFECIHNMEKLIDTSEAVLNQFLIINKNKFEVNFILKLELMYFRK